MGPISIGDEAPNFDLSSTEDALLMLRDEVSQASAVLYFFADPVGDRTRRDLEALNRNLPELKKLKARVLAISPVKLDDLKKLQVEGKLRFPLLHDDRNFSDQYGIAAGEEGKPAAPALVVVSRKQRILWLANPVAAVADAISQVAKLLKAQPSPTTSYPKSIVNRLIDLWVN